MAGRRRLKDILHGPVGAGLVLAYLRLVSATSRHVYEPPDPGRRFGEPGFFGHPGPVIYAHWHGHSFILGFRFRRRNFPTLMVTRHGDGAVFGRAMQRMGVPVVFGSGDTRGGRDKGGARAFLALLRDLRRGQSVTMTADVPKTARVVGEGIVLLARKSGAPIVPVAMATSRRRILKTWDRMQLHLPFSRMVFVSGEPLFVPDDGSELDIHRQRLKDALERAQARAFQIADRRAGG